MDNKKIIALYLYIFGGHLLALLGGLLIVRFKKKKWTLKYFYSWFGILLTLILAQIITSFIYSKADSPPGGFFFYGVFVVPFFWFIFTNLFSILLILVKHKKEEKKKKIKLIKINFLTSCAFFLFLFFAFIFLLKTMTGVEYKKVEKYKKLVSIKNVSFVELDRNNNGILDSIEVTFEVESQVKEPIRTQVRVGLESNKETLMSRTGETRYIDLINSGRNKCKIHLDAFADIDLANVDVADQILQIKLTADKIGLRPEGIFGEWQKQTSFRLNDFESNVRFRSTTKEPSYDFYPDTRPKTCRKADDLSND